MYIYSANTPKTQQNFHRAISLLVLALLLLVSFSTTVDAAQKTLTWDPPMKREDGSSLYPGEIHGYRIYVAASDVGKAQSLGIAKASTNSVIVSGLVPGVYEFAVSAIDTDGLESRRSAGVRVVIRRR